MPLEPGTTLGSFQVIAKIGEGGMGEVYQARDTKLDRNVALKVLPEAFTADPDRLARFEREAKVLASLNHPNIAHIHGLEDSGGIRALVLELVDGPTLADRIAQGPIPLDEARPIATQIADALEAAHAAGVIHRDLKPANIKVKSDGTVKVLDFGLAKAFQPDALDVDVSASPTISLTAAATQMGMVIGTAAYMSPEQARAKSVDKRTDIWAFGAVVYEMLTGRKAFGGDDLSQTLARVIEREPDWDALSGLAPPVLTLFLRRCLDKDPVQRIHDVADVRLALDGAFETAVVHTVAPEPPPSARRAVLPWGIAAVAVAGLVVALVQSWSREAPPAPSPVRFAVEMPVNAAVGLQAGSLAISPDGSRVAFPVGRGPTGRLHLRSLDSFEAEPVRGTDGGIMPFFSPDGTWLAFFADGQLKRVSVDGGTSLPIVEAVGSLGASWGEHDAIVYSPSFFEPLWQVDAEGREPHRLTTLESGELGHWWPDVLPEGRGVLFTVYRRGGGHTIDAYASDTGQRHTVLDGAFARYAATGHLLFVRNGALMAVPFDADRLKTLGAAVPVLEEIGYDSTTAGAHYAVSDDGALVYLTSAELNPLMALISVDRDGAAELLFEPGFFLDPHVSPDGGHIALGIKDAANNPDVWVMDLDRGGRTRVTDSSGVEGALVWTPDGNDLILFQEGLDGSLTLGAGRAAADGSGETVPLVVPEQSDVLPGSLTPDGRVLAYTLSENSLADLWTVSLDGPSEPTPFLQTAASEGLPAFSPNGEWLAYQSDDSGRLEIYVQPYPGPGRRVAVSTEGGAEPVWSRDGGEIFYRPLDENGLMVAEVAATVPELVFGVPRQLFEGHYDRHPWGLTIGQRNYDVMPDGQRFIMLRRADARLPRFNVVLNWDSELLARVPIE